MQRQMFSKPSIMRLTVQRREAVEGGAASSDLESTISQARSGGTPLGEPIRRQMEGAFGTDFSGVRVHTNNTADTLNRSLSARAFTTGTNIFFKQGEYNPSSSSGKELLAHELTHVVQQNEGTVQRQQAPNIQRSKEDGEPDNLNSNLNPTVFKSQTYGKTWTRDAEITLIDRWLQATDNSETWEDQQYNLIQVLEACEQWMTRYGNSDKIPFGKKSSSEGRKPIIEELIGLTRQALQLSGGVGNPGSSVPSLAEESGSTGLSDETYEALEGGLTSVGSGSGITGDISDLGKVEEHLNGTATDFLDGGANFFGGALAIRSGKNAWTEAETTGEKILAVTQIGSGAGQMAHGVGKTVKASGVVSGGPDLAEATKDKWGGAGDLGGALADGASAINNIALTFNSLHNIYTNWRVSTAKEKIASGLEAAGNIADSVKDGFNTAKGIGNVSKAWAGGTYSGAAAMTQAASIAGIVTGSITIAQGGFQIYRAKGAKDAVKETEKKQQELIDTIYARYLQIEEESASLQEEFAFLDDPSIDYETKSRQVSAIIIQIEEIEEGCIKLSATLKELSVVQDEFSPATSAMKKIQNRKMEEGGFKMAQGGTSVASSALVLSGVGAPIAIGVAAIGGILSLGFAIVKYSRNKAANLLTTISRRITSGGKPKAQRDEDVSYREMENRVYKCYYSHMTQVLTRDPAPGLSEDEFSDIKTFARQEKEDRVNKDKQKHIIKIEGLNDKKDKSKIEPEVKKLSESQMKQTWIEIQNEKQKVITKEAPKGKIGRLKLYVSASSHKSGKAHEANVADVVAALYKLCTRGFNKEKGQFVEAPIQPTGQADPETLKEFGNITLLGLLKAAAITEARWAKWLNEAEKQPADKQEEVLKKQLTNHIK
ncbi:DUF4157 domain-containing protein [Laspinema sp. D3]|nr:DUF4157 domain-containing protein [Laspinema sp. D2c]